MNIYVENGKTVKVYSVRPEVAKAVMTSLEADGELVWSETHSGYGVTIKDLEQEPVLDKVKAEIEKQDKWLSQAGYNAYNVDIALNAIKLTLAESEE